MNINEGLTQVHALDQVATLLLPLAARIERAQFRLFLAVCQGEGSSLQRLARRLRASWSEVMRGVAFLEQAEDEDTPNEGQLLRCVQPNTTSTRKEVYLTEHGRKLREELVACFGQRDYVEMSLQAMAVIQQALSDALVSPGDDVLLRENEHE